MIKINDWVVSGFEAAVAGMRLPYKSIDNDDSFYETVNLSDLTYDEVIVVNHMMENYIDPDASDDGICCFRMGEKNHELAMKLVAAGTDHSKFIRMIHCQALVTAPLYWWKQMDTYKVATVSNSESTMHTITKKEFELDDFSHEYMTKPVTHSKKGRGGYWHTINLAGVFETQIYDLNLIRKKYLETKDKELWYAMIQLLPSSYNQTRMIDLNYQTLRSIYFARKNHKLDEWHEFCDWIEKLPYSELITGEIKS